MEKVFQKKQVSHTKIQVISTIVFILAGFIAFVTIPAVIFKHMEGWTDNFVVVTLATIGFSDFVAGRNADIHYQEWYKPLAWFWTLVGCASFAAVMSMIGDSLRVLSKKTKEEAGEITVEWKANVMAEFREMRRQLSVEIHDRLQWAASEDNIIIKFGSSAKLTKKKTEDLKKTISEDVHKTYETFQIYSLDKKKKKRKRR